MVSVDVDTEDMVSVDVDTEDMVSVDVDMVLDAELVAVSNVIIPNVWMDVLL
jgi:hypothetical protein